MGDNLFEIIAIGLSILLPLLGTVGFVRSNLARQEQRMSALEDRLREHRDNSDAHVTRDLIQNLDRRFAQLDTELGGPTGREWGEIKTEVREVRHDLRTLRMAMQALQEDL